MAAVVPSYKGFRYPMEIISHCVWWLPLGALPSRPAGTAPSRRA
jgi:hypothetical protein